MPNALRIGLLGPLQVRAELHFRVGDTAAAARVCAEQLAWLDGKPSVW